MWVPYRTVYRRGHTHTTRSSIHRIPGDGAGESEKEKNAAGWGGGVYAPATPGRPVPRVRLMAGPVTTNAAAPEYEGATKATNKEQRGRTHRNNQDAPWSNRRRRQRSTDRSAIRQPAMQPARHHGSNRHTVKESNNGDHQGQAAIPYHDCARRVLPSRTFRGPPLAHPPIPYDADGTIRERMMCCV